MDYKDSTMRQQRPEYGAEPDASSQQYFILSLWSSDFVCLYLDRRFFLIVCLNLDRFEHSLRKIHLFYAKLNESIIIVPHQFSSECPISGTRQEILI